MPAKLEYKQIVGKDGRSMNTATVKLYAPEGSYFYMPQGGEVLTYVARGYKTEPDAAWNKAHADYTAVQAASKKLSDFQREIKDRAKAAEVKAALMNDLAEMERIDAEMRAIENGLDSSDTPNDAIAAINETVKAVSEVSKPAAKRGRPAKVKS